ncbi:hypothetical protein FACS1894113_1500 [Alphaproteobacteria bacterium]|nr:hypothetical protein FACS1894113_1500 [Alphaproteobacteria bacterium]
MIFSFFINDKECHIYTEKFSNIYKVDETRKMADNVMSFFSDALKKINGLSIKKLIFSSGPSSFTTTRISNSIAKGMKIAKDDLSITSVSSFLTYFSLSNASRGTFAIPTNCGDYYCATLSNLIISKRKIQTNNSLNKLENVHHAEKFSQENLAFFQLLSSQSELAKTNRHLITETLDQHYEFTPKYRY